MKKKKRIWLNVLLAILALIWLFPIYFLIVNMSKTAIEYGQTNFWNLPQDWSLFYNIQNVAEKCDLIMPFINSLIYATVGSAIGVFLAALAGFAISVLRVKHGNMWFLLIYLGTIFPFQLYLIPNFVLFQNTGLYDTRIGMILIYIALIIPFALFVMRNYFFGVSKDMLESARIDGASDFTIFKRIYAPVAKPALIATFLFQFLWIWGDLMFGLTLTKSDSVRTIMSAANAMPVGDVPSQLVVSFLISIPTIIVFIFAGKYIEQGVAFTDK